MIATNVIVTQTCPRLFRVTCVAHGLHNAVERARANFESADRPIATVIGSRVKHKDRRAKSLQLPGSRDSQIRKLVGECCAKISSNS